MGQEALSQGLEQLARTEKAALTAGIDLWHTAPVPRVGIPSIRTTDGPNGARGDRWASGTSACMPCGSALAATWNRDLVRRVGRVLGDEAHAKGAQVLLAPTVNIHRHPLNGRHFESYSEDPYLSAEMGVAYIRGVQDRGVSAVVKHFVCNDQEHERHTISVDVDERALREIYLPPFEAAVKRAKVWAIMSAYNRLAGTYCSEHRQLLTDLLREEWGFDGLVMSDWNGTHGAAAVEAGLDLEMPGPAKFMGPHLDDKLRTGEIDEAAVDRAAAKVLQLIERTTPPTSAGPRVAPPGEVARQAAREAFVLLRNDGVLPLQEQQLRRVAVIGPLANRPAIHGGGSAEVTPSYGISALQGLRGRLGERVQVDYEIGCGLPGSEMLPLVDATLLRRDTLLEVAYFANPDFEGPAAASETFAQSRMTWMGPPTDGVPGQAFSARVSGTFVPDRSGQWRFGLGSAGQSRLSIDGTLVVDNFSPVPGKSFWGQGSTQVTGELELQGGREYALLAEFRTATDRELTGLRFGAEPVLPGGSIEQAAAAAQQADVAILVVGYDSRWESEGFDRPHMDLPGEQNELVRAVIEANPRTIVVVNAGAPVTMDWAPDAAAVVQLWFPGMECGNALADVLLGDVDASGRLPTTFPRRLEDTPALAHYPGQDGVVQYAEGIFVGYRHYDRRGIEPRFCFGHGLSYTTFAYANLRAERAADGVTLSIEVTNTGQRPGSEVVQVYVADLEASVDVPEQQLKEFAKLQLAPGETQTVRFELPRQAFTYWDTERHTWLLEPGDFEVRVGSSSRAIHATARVRVE